MRTQASRALNLLGVCPNPDFEEAVNEMLDPATMALMVDLDGWTPALPCTAAELQYGYLILFRDMSFLTAAFLPGPGEGLVEGILTAGTVEETFGTGAEFLRVFTPASTALRVITSAVHEVYHKTSLVMPESHTVH